MKILILSDLHMEFNPYEQPNADFDTVVLAGDIGLGKKNLEKIRNIFQDKTIIYVLGNHEYYGFRDLHSWPKTLKEEAEYHDIKLLENDVYEKDGIVFIGATLWTDFKFYDLEEQSKFIVGRSLNDYYQIVLNGFPIQPNHTQMLHYKSKQFIIDKLKEYKDKKTIVVTHHAPHENSIHSTFVGDLCNPGFASKLDDIFIDYTPNFWIHGHVHNSFDYVFAKTRVICNPKGYIKYGTPENIYFDPYKIIEI